MPEAFLDLHIIDTHGNQGRPIILAADRIESIEEATVGTPVGRRGGVTRIVMQSGLAHVVAESYSDVTHLLHKSRNFNA